MIFKYYAPLKTLTPHESPLRGNKKEQGQYCPHFTGEDANQRNK